MSSPDGLSTLIANILRNIGDNKKEKEIEDAIAPIIESNIGSDDLSKLIGNILKSISSSERVEPAPAPAPTPAPASDNDKETTNGTNELSKLISDILKGISNGKASFDRVDGPIPVTGPVTLTDDDIISCILDLIEALSCPEKAGVFGKFANLGNLSNLGNLGNLGNLFGKKPQKTPENPQPEIPEDNTCKPKKDTDGNDIYPIAYTSEHCIDDKTNKTSILETP